MFFKKAVIITLSSLFLTAGCVSISSPEPEPKITNLEYITQITTLKNELIESQSILDQKQLTLEQNKLTLEQANVDLTASQQKIIEMSKRLKQSMAAQKKAEKEAEKNDNVDKVVVKKVSEKDRYLDKTVLGQAEWTYVTAAKENFKTRIDTGAATSSINAIDIQRFERDGEKWVRFNISHHKDSQKKMIEAKIVRIVKIIQSGQPDENTERPVVRLHIRIGDISNQTEFTLTDRLHMTYPVLIGRSFMKDVVLVDVSQEYTHPKYQVEDSK